MTEARFLKLAVLGDPVEHSASPRLQTGFLAAERLAGSYEAIRVPAGDGARAIDDLRARGYVGLNITTPLKTEAFARAEWHDATALASGSVNTLVLGERIDGYNTDGIGTLGALTEAGLANVAGARILVLGAGPTARAAVAALVAASAAVFIWNRTPARAAETAAALDAHLFDPAYSYDAVFAALPPGVEVIPAPLRAAILATPILIDANYAERATLARTLGRSALDGLAMLRHSARASFELFRSNLGA
jgi:shikimate dehydrogenase